MISVRIFLILTFRYDGAQQTDKSNYSKFSPQKMP